MDRLNHNHLRCFWAVAREGSIASACKTLGLAQPTISKQIGDLEESLGVPLFRRAGRRLVLTDMGRTVQSYADDIFHTSQELLDVVRGGVVGRPAPFHVGVSDVVPKLITRLVLEPSLRADTPVRLDCREGKPERLLADLAIGGLDLVISDTPPPPGARVKVFTQELLTSQVRLFGPSDLLDRYAGNIPESLNGAPVLLPAENTAMRRAINVWLAETGARPVVVAEFEDSALLKTFAEAGHGLFFAPAAVGDHIEHRLGMAAGPVVDSVTETIYAITADRRVTHPGVLAVFRGQGIEPPTELEPSEF